MKITDRQDAGKFFEWIAWAAIWFTAGLIGAQVVEAIRAGRL